MFHRGTGVQKRFIPRREFIPIDNIENEDQMEDEEEGMLKLEPIEDNENKYPGMRLLKKLKKEQKRRIKDKRLSRLLSNLVIQEF